MKHLSPKIWPYIFLFGGILTLFPAKLISCPIPVFRYALEYWDADPYVLEIFYYDSLGQEEENTMNYLRTVSEEEGSKANFEIRKIDLSIVENRKKFSHINNLSPGNNSFMALLFPEISGINKIIWSGPLNERNIDLLISSPVREKIGHKLVGEVTAVWIFLESGNKSKDREAHSILEKELNHLEQTIVLRDPELWLRDSEEIENSKVSKIKFDIISLSRDDPTEKHFIDMLISSENDLKDFANDPIVFPVFGKGIILYGLVGKGINEWNIRDAAAFITGDCSCQAKVGNPGVDLLMAMDWDNNIENITDIGISNPLSGMGDFGRKQEEAKKLLESATLKRLGTGTAEKKPSVLKAEISGSAQTPDEEDDSRKKDAQTTSYSLKNKGESTVLTPGKAVTEESVEENASLSNQFENPRDISAYIMGFGVFILLVISGGVVFFVKTAKK